MNIQRDPKPKNVFVTVAALGSFTQEAQHKVMEALGTGTTDVGDIERYQTFMLIY